MTTQTTTQTPDEHIETTTTQTPSENNQPQTETLITTKKPRFELGIRHRIIIVAAALVASFLVYLILPSKKVAVTPAAVNQAENVTPDPTTTTPSTPSTNSSTDGYAVNSNSPTPPPLAAPDVTSPTLTPATPNLPNTPPPPNPMTDQLTNINQQLQTIETTLSSQGNSQVQAEIHNVITEIGNMMSDSTTTLNTAIQSSEQSLASQLNGMQGQLSNIQQLSQPGSYVDPSNLPFTLLFIDNVGGQNVVTVNYNNISTPLSAGQSLAGWKLTTADYASQYAVFQNAKDQLVKVSNTGAQ